MGQRWSFGKATLQGSTGTLPLLTQAQNNSHVTRTKGLPSLQEPSGGTTRSLAQMLPQLAH